MCDTVYMGNSVFALTWIQLLWILKHCDLLINIVDTSVMWHAGVWGKNNDSSWLVLEMFTHENIAYNNIWSSLENSRVETRREKAAVLSLFPRLLAIVGNLRLLRFFSIAVGARIWYLYSLILENYSVTASIAFLYMQELKKQKQKEKLLEITWK